jgi:UDP-glucose 4-epimerase
VVAGLAQGDQVLSQLRYRRRIDNPALKAAGCRIAPTTRDTVIAHAEAMRVRPLLEQRRQGYRYEREVEEFLRWSPHVRRREGEGVPPRARAR